MLYTEHGISGNTGAKSMTEDPLSGHLPFRPSGRFSTWVARPNRCATLGHHRGHDPTNVPRCHPTPCGLPRQERVQAQVTCQRHLERRQGHDPVPSLTQLWGAQAGGEPEHIRCEKPEEMVFPEPQAGSLWNLLHSDHQTRGSRVVPRAAVCSTRMTERVSTRSCWTWTSAKRLTRVTRPC